MASLSSPTLLLKTFVLHTLLYVNLRPALSSLEHVWFHCSVKSRNTSHGKHLLELSGRESRGGVGAHLGGVWGSDLWTAGTWLSDPQFSRKWAE